MAAATTSKTSRRDPRSRRSRIISHCSLRPARSATAIVRPRRAFWRGWTISSYCILEEAYNEQRKVQAARGDHPEDRGHDRGRETPAPYLHQLHRLLDLDRFPLHPVSDGPPLPLPGSRRGARCDIQAGTESSQGCGRDPVVSGIRLRFILRSGTRRRLPHGHLAGPSPRTKFHVPSAPSVDR